MEYGLVLINGKIFPTSINLYGTDFGQTNDGDFHKFNFIINPFFYLIYMIPEMYIHGCQNHRKEKGKERKILLSMNFLEFLLVIRARTIYNNRKIFPTEYFLYQKTYTLD